MSTDRDKLNNFKLKYNDDLKKYLSKIDMVCLVAPTGVGKDALINWLVSADKSLAQLKFFRTARPGPAKPKMIYFFCLQARLGIKKF